MSSKLANRPEGLDERGQTKVKTLIETRGEGGFVVLAPSHGSVHPTGNPYVLLAGSFATIAVISPGERRALFGLAQVFDAQPMVKAAKTAIRQRQRITGDGERPGDRFNAETDWIGLLEPRGWVRVYEREGVCYWRRPGKDHSISATTGFGGDWLYVFSSSTEFEWRPTRWLMAFGLFNPHVKLQIRKIAALEGAIEPVESDDDDFSDWFAVPTVAFPGNWRKFLPTDPTPAHWYTGPEFARLVHLKAAVDPGQAIGAFIQEFKGLSRVWHQTSKTVVVKTVGQLADAPPAIPVLHEAMRAASAAPRPEVLGRVGPEHFRQRFHEHFQIVGDRYWYKHRWAEAEGMPYLIEVAIAETEQRGGIFYGLNYSVPFGDPLADTVMDFESKDGSLNAKGIAGFLQDAGVYCGERYGKSLSIAAAVHLVMPLLPALDRGKSRLAIPVAMASAIAATMANAAKVLTKEFRQWRQGRSLDLHRRQQRCEQQLEQARKEQEREQARSQKGRDREQKAQQREGRERRRAEQAQARLARGGLMDKREALYSILLDTYLEATDGERLYLTARDLYYAIRPRFLALKVKPSKNRQGEESAELDFNYFSQDLLPTYRRQHHPMTMIDYKARGILYEPHSGREIPIGDNELRHFTFPHLEYNKILFIEKEGIWQTLKQTGGIEFARRYDLAIASCAGYATEATRRLLAKAQQGEGYQIFVWHDADPYGYNIARTLAEQTDRMPDHKIDVFDIGLRLAEAQAMGLQTETFTRKQALPTPLLPLLSEEERRLFEGTRMRVGENRFEWRGCQRVEINAIPVRERIAYLERHFLKFSRRPESGAAMEPALLPKVSPPPADLAAYARQSFESSIRARIREAIDRCIDLDAIAARVFHRMSAPVTFDAVPLQAELETSLSDFPDLTWSESLRRIVGRQTAGMLDDRRISIEVSTAIREQIERAQP